MTLDAWTCSNADPGDIIQGGRQVAFRNQEELYKLSTRLQSSPFLSTVDSISRGATKT
jgi:hypothetical protein